MFSIDITQSFASFIYPVFKFFGNLGEIFPGVPSDKLAVDVHEDKDLTAEQPEKVKQLQALWDEWNRSNIKPLWGADYADNDGAEPGTAKKKKAAK